MQQPPQACAPLRARPERLLPDDFWMFSYKVSVSGGRWGMVWTVAADCGHPSKAHESLGAQASSRLLDATQMLYTNHKCICGGISSNGGVSGMGLCGMVTPLLILHEALQRGKVASNSALAVIMQPLLLAAAATAATLLHTTGSDGLSQAGSNVLSRVQARTHLLQQPHHTQRPY
jgi:hypothetical protein